MTASSTTPTRFDSELFAAAKTAGGRTHRSAAQQLAHWARLGQELEASAGLSHRDIQRVLDGHLSYDTVGEHEQAVVRSAWREQIEEDIVSLDLRARFDAEGRTRWSEADPAGNVSVTRTKTQEPAKTARPRPRRAAKSA